MATVTRALLGALLIAVCLSPEAAAEQDSWQCCLAPAPAQPAVPDFRGTSSQPVAVHVTELPQKNADEIHREMLDRVQRQSSEHRTFLLGVAGWPRCLYLPCGAR